MDTNTQNTETVQTTTTVNANDAEQNKIMAVLAYLFFLIPLLAAKDSPFARYHANQGLVLFIFEVVGLTLGSIIPFIGWCLILPVTAIGALVLAIMGIMNAINLKMQPLPVIGGISIIK